MRILILGLIILLSGCATGQLAWTPEQRQQIATRVYPLPYDKVFNAIVDRYKSKGTPLAIIDRENGIIATDYISMGGVMWDTGKAKLTISLSKLGDNLTRIGLYIHCEGYSNTLGIAATDDLITEGKYREWFADFEKKLNTIPVLVKE